MNTPFKSFLNFNRKVNLKLKDENFLIDWRASRTGWGHEKCGLWLVSPSCYPNTQMPFSGKYEWLCISCLSEGLLPALLPKEQHVTCL